MFRLPTDEAELKHRQTTVESVQYVVKAKRKQFPSFKADTLEK
jgi:hypothetical protein